MSESSLVPGEQKTVYFYDDEITAVVTQLGGKSIIYIPLRPLCEYLELNWSGQFQRLKRDPVLSEVSMSVCVTQTDIDPTSRQPRTSDLLAIPLDYLNGWLFGVNANRVKAEIRGKLIRYQRECYQVLAREFVKAPPPPSSALAQVREMGLAIARMAEEQMEFDRRLSGTETAVTILDDRLQILEAKLAPPEHAVTNEQASQVSQAVKAVAIASGKQSNRNEFGAIYGELYRKYGITSYKLLPAARFDEAMRWLSEWYQSLTNESLPF